VCKLRPSPLALLCPPIPPIIVMCYVLCVVFSAICSVSFLCVMCYVLSAMWYVPFLCHGYVLCVVCHVLCVMCYVLCAPPHNT
jgi:hypothetical protein